VTRLSISRRKVGFSIALILLLSAIVAGYSIVKRNAENFVQQLVESQSGGKLLFQVDKVKFDLLKLSLEFQNPLLITHDTTVTETGYHIKAQSLSVKVHTLWTVFTKSQFLIDSVAVQSPEIEINRYHLSDKVNISVPEEIDIVYGSLRKILAIVRLDYLHIDGAKIIINDFTSPGSLPMVISKINLVIEKVNDAKGTGDTRFLLADRIMFEIFDQDIASSNGRNRLKFKKFRLSTHSRTIRLDSCFISGNSADSSGAGFNTFVDTLRVTNVDFNALVKDGKIKLDSALCINPDVNFLVSAKGENRRGRKTLQEVVENSDSLDFMLKKMLGDLDIGYLEVKNANVRIITKKGDKSKIYQTEKSNFSLKGFRVNSDPAVPIILERFNLYLKNYKEYSPDSLYVVAFDEIQVIDKGISLLNFRVGPTRKNNELLSREIKMAAFEFNDIDWPKLLYESRIVAHNAILVKPEFHFRLPGIKKRTSGVKSNPLDILHELKNKIQVEGLLVRDGSVKLDIANRKHIALTHVDAEVGVNQLLQVENWFRIVDALDTLSFSSGEFKSPELSLAFAAGRFSSWNQSLKFSQIVQANTDKSLTVKLQEVALDGLYFHSPDSININYFGWGAADILVNTPLKQSDTLKTKDPVHRTISIESLSGRNSNFDIRGREFDATGRINHLKTDQMILANGRKPSISGLFIDGNYIHLKKGDLRGDVAPFIIQEQGSSVVNNLVVNLPVNGETLFINIPKILFVADINRLIAGDFSMESVEVQRPVISFLPKSTESTTQSNRSAGKLPRLNIGSLRVIQPSLIGLPKSISGKMQLNTGRSDWDFVGIHSDATSLSIDSLRFITARPYFSNDRLRLLPTGRETVAVNASGIQFQPGTNEKKSSWKVLLDQVETSGFDLNLMEKDTVKQHLVMESLHLTNLRLNNATATNLPELFHTNHDFTISRGNILLENGQIRLRTANLSMDQAVRSLSLDSLTFSPMADKETFMKGRVFRHSYIEVGTGSVQVRSIDFDQFLKDSVFHSGKVVVNNLHFLNYIDKRLPFQQGIEKPMLTDLFKKIKLKFVLDSLLLRNSAIQAQEINDKTLLPASIDLTKIRGIVTGIRNCHYRLNDSLKFNLFARLLDATDLRVNYEHSYTDTLSGFKLKAIASSFDMTKLNPMLQPIASARVKSGYLDTLRMSVVGRKHVAVGTMKMHYHNLNVQYLNQGVEANATAKTKLISFFANRVVRKQRLLGSGEVYAERDPEKGFVNYWVKIFIGGVFTNTGVKSDKRQEKKYANTIQKYKVPPIPNIPVDY